METRTGFLISRISQVQARVFQRLLQDCGVEEFNGPQGRILYVLWQTDGVPIVDLAHATGLAKNTLTSMLERMEGAGLVLRLPGERDKRQTIIRLTDRARALEARYEQVSQEMNALFYRDLTQADATLLDGLLDKILENLEETERKLKRGKENEHGKNQHDARE